MIFFVIAALLVILDQATKFYIRATMAVGATKVLIPNWLGLNYVQNTGAAFSSFDQYTTILAVISLVVSLLQVDAPSLWPLHPYAHLGWGSGQPDRPVLHGLCDRYDPGALCEICRL